MTTAAPTMLDAALTYSGRGWHVFPVHSVDDTGRCSCGCGDPGCKTRGKHPRVPHGVLDASVDPEQLRRWWRQWPEANIGIATGPSGLVGIDIDPDKGGDESWRDLRTQLGPDIEDTITAITGGGGRHFIYRSPAGGLVRNSASALAPGIDVRAAGGYLIVDPSRHRSGRRYTWEIEASPADRDPAPLPPALLLLLAEAGKAGSGQRANGPVAEDVVEGGRNDFLARVAGQWRAIGWSFDAIFAALREVNARRCKPPLPDAEVESVARSISRYPPGATVTFDGLKATAGQSDPPSPLYRCTDVGNAERFYRDHHEQVRFCHPLGKFYLWTGTHWAVDATNQVIELGKRTARGIYREVAALAAQASATEESGQRDALSARVKELTRWAKESESRNRLVAMIELAKSMPDVPIDTGELNTDPWLLNCRNGTVDLRTGELREHHREDFITTVLPYDYEADAECPLWLTFLDRIFEGNAELIGFIQRAIGYTLTGKTDEQCFFLLHGAGQNGKGRLVLVIAALLGEMAKQAGFDTFLVPDRGNSHRPRNDLADLFGARFVAASEANEGSRFDEAVIKSLTGDDKITARHLFHNNFTYTPQFKIWLSTNHKPVIRGTDFAIWRRIKLIPFNVIIPMEERDPKLLEKLFAELPGIAAWAIRGALAWQAHGLGEPAAVRNATGAYREESDPVGQFIEDTCVCTPGNHSLHVPAKDLYEAYTRWATEAGEKPWTQKTLGRALTERGLTRERAGSGRYQWYGIGLRDCGETDGDTASNHSNHSNRSSANYSYRHSREENFAGNGSNGSNGSTNGSGDEKTGPTCAHHACPGLAQFKGGPFGWCVDHRAWGRLLNDAAQAGYPWGGDDQPAETVRCAEWMNLVRTATADGLADARRWLDEAPPCGVTGCEAGPVVEMDQIHFCNEHLAWRDLYGDALMTNFPYPTAAGHPPRAYEERRTYWRALIQGTPDEATLAEHRAFFEAMKTAPREGV